MRIEFKHDLLILWRSILTLEVSKIKLAAIFFTMVLSNTFNLFIPLLFGNIVNGVTNKSIVYIKINLLYIILVFIISNIISYINSLLLMKLNYDIEMKMKRKVFKSILEIPHDKFIIIDKGKLINNIEEDTSVFSSLLLDNINTFVNMISMIISFVFMMYINSLLTLMLLITFPLTSYIFVISGKKIKNKEIMYKEKYDNFFSFINETLYGWKILRIFGVEDRRAKIFKDKISDLYMIKLKKFKIELSSQILTNNVSFFMNMINILVAIFFIFKGKLTLGMFTAFNEYSQTFKDGLLMFSSLGSTIQQTIVSINRVNEILKYEEKKIPLLEEENEKISKIEIENLSYSINENNMILKNIKMNFKANEIYLIKGESGSGKTTLFNILSKFITDYDGNILFNNVNLKEISNARLRKRLIYVTQENYLFSISIKENITLYRNITLEKIMGICKRLNIHDTIMALPYKYDTIINKNGVGLSGGERQRICIARAIVANPDIYLFDEITSAIDKKNISDLISLIEEIFEDSIVIITSHEDLNFSIPTIEYNLVDRNFI